MKELDSKLYSVLFASNLNSMEKYEKLKDLLREAYALGEHDEYEATMTLFKGDYFDELC